MSETTALATRVTFSAEQIALIKRTICVGASDDELRFFLYQCERTQLDPFSRQIYSIARRSRNPRTNQWETVRQTQTSIDGFRVIAERTGHYAGQLGPFWCGNDGVWQDVWLDDAPPSAARVGALRDDFREPCWGVAKFTEYCQMAGHPAQPTHMWDKFPSTMIAKCAEALALRKAFPQQLSGLYTNDEMMQAVHEAPARLAKVESLPEEPDQPLAQDRPDEPVTNDVIYPLPDNGDKLKRWLDGTFRRIHEAQGQVARQAALKVRIADFTAAQVETLLVNNQWNARLQALPEAKALNALLEETIAERRDAEEAEEKPSPGGDEG